jgi:RNA polymerase sigma-70 factor (ECF subfamily)
MQQRATHPNTELADGELVAAAKAGNGAALGLLLERHRPRLFAAALHMLGYRTDAEDAVQETCLAAVQHIGSVRDPDAAGAWLNTVLRRACLQLERRRRSSEVLTDSVPDRPDERPGAEERIERLALRDWIWGALQRLPEPLRVSAMLRYFGSYDSYDEVAAILGVPIGTVRSRLSEVKIRLADALLASAGLIDDQVRVRARAREQFWNAAFEDVFRRGASDRFVSYFTRDLLIGWSGGKRVRGREHLAAEIDGDLAVGVRIDLERVMTNDGISVVEGRFLNPPEAPDHCPPGVALVFFGRDDRTSAMRLHLAPRAPRLDEG